VRVLAVVFSCVVLLACAGGGSDSPSVDVCAPLAELAPLPEPECRQSEESRSFERMLQAAIQDDAESLLVRVELGPDAHVRAVCAEGVATRTRWSAERAVGRRVPELLAMSPGPACLAGRRLDLNRRAAKMAEAENAEYLCTERRRQTLETTPGIDPLRRSQQVWNQCLEHDATWILVHRVGVMDPVVYARPEVVDPPPVRARDTASRCSREFNFDAKIACIESEGWERLECDASCHKPTADSSESGTP
jgi:hypothetical protein